MRLWLRKAKAPNSQSFGHPIESHRPEHTQAVDGTGASLQYRNPPGDTDNIIRMFKNRCHVLAPYENSASPTLPLPSATARLAAMKQLILLAIASLFPLSLTAADKGVVALFNGKDFTGWTQKGGVAKYTVKDGVIVGTAVAGTPNSFMCTEKLYGDFVLEYEYLCDNRLNSGVQIRSNMFAKDTTVDLGNGKTRKIAKGRVHGYQVEIDPNKPDRMWSGGVYDEGRRGWLFPGQHGGDAAQFTATGVKTYKPGKWNTVRVECRGDSIKTWLNGVPRADFKDSLTAKGFIGLQVHGIGGKKELIGAQVRWRNLVLKELK